MSNLLMHYLKTLWEFTQLHLITISAFMILIPSVIMGSMILHRSVKEYKKYQEFIERFEVFERPNQEKKESFKNPVLRNISLHINSLIDIPPYSIKLLTYLFVLISLGIGLFASTSIYNTYLNWDVDLPYNYVSIWLPILLGLMVGCIPFLLLHAIVQNKRIKLSNQLLEYVEEFEKKYLVRNNDVYAALMDLIEVLKPGTLLDVTFRIAQSFQRKDPVDLERELRVFEHIVGTTFARMFCISIREAVGLVDQSENPNNREYKDIRLALRSLIDKMHGKLQIDHKDRPNKREIIQVGFITFPLIYGAYKLSIMIMGENTAKYFLLESPTGMNLFIGAVICGFLALSVNIFITRRKFDM